METVEKNGQLITYGAHTIKKIIGEAAMQAHGVLGPGGGGLCTLKEAFETAENQDVTCGITVKVEDNRLDAEVLLTTEENVEMNGIMDDVKQRVRDAIATYTGLEIGEIRIEIVDTQTRETYMERFRDGR